MASSSKTTAIAATTAVAGFVVGTLVVKLLETLKKRAKDSCIYLDYNGTTPVYPNVRAAMAPYFERHFGNPSSPHWYAKAPRAAVNRARQQLLRLLGAEESSELSSIWFTACGTESDNLAIRTALDACQGKFKNKVPHVVTCNVEHAAVAGYLQVLEAQGQCQVDYVRVGTDGRVSAEDITAAIRPTTVLVTLMLANNESGALQPVREVADYCRRHDILMHTDAAQAAGKVPVDLDSLGHPDMVSLVGHKLGAPKGVACLYVRDGCLEQAGRHLHSHGVLLIGGGQEFGKRGGTENVPYIVGFGQAAEDALRGLEKNAAHMEQLRARLLNNLKELLGDENVRANGPVSPSLRLPNTLSVGLRNVHSGELLQAIGDQVAASSGATCHSTGAVSGVLKAMKVPMEFAQGTLRLSVGPSTTVEEIDRASSIIAAEAKRQLQRAVV